MDLADDIAYSTYDLEDAFKAGFLSPLGVLSFDERLRARVASRVGTAIGRHFTAQDVLEVLLEAVPDIDLTRDNAILVYQQSLEAAANGYSRTAVTAELVGDAVNAVRINYDTSCPALSKVYLEDSIRRRVETLKHLTYNAVILSPRLKVSEYRGIEIVMTIF